MMRFSSMFWTLADDDAQNPPTERPSRPDTGTLGGTLTSRLSDALGEMGPADAADTGGVAIDPTHVLPAEAGGIRQVGAGEQAYRADLAAGGQADNLLDVEDNPQAHLPPDMIDTVTPRREE